MITVGLYLDAAGGSNMKVCRGLGCSTRDAWHLSLGICLKMTFLEACAALLGISSMAKLLANKPIVIYCDNIGMVYGFAKGYSRCLYAYTA